MIRCLHSTFHTSIDDLNHLFACNRISALVWNKILDLSKFYRIITNGKWIKESDLKVLLKNVYPLHSQSVQAVIEKYIQNREDTLLANKKGFKNKYPWKYKYNFPTTWKADGFEIKDNILYLSLARFNHKNQFKIKIILPKHIVKELKDKRIQQIELIYKHQLLLSFMYKIKNNNNITGVNFEQGSKQQVAGINSQTSSIQPMTGVDLGEIHSISTYTNTNKNCIITGRYLRSLRRLQDKSLGKLNHMLSRCVKNSKRYKRLRKVKRKMLIKTNNQIKDCNHKITNELVKFVKNNNISKVVIGDIRGIEKNTCKKNKKNSGNKHNGRLSKWNYGEHIRQIKYKLDSIGVDIELINESYTSQTCPCCGKRNKCKTRNYRCSCGYKCHRDIHGARNILHKYIYGRIYTIGLKIEEIKKITYLRPLKNEKAN